MSNPRRIVDNEGIGVRRETYFADGSTILFDATEANGSAQAGLAVQQTTGAMVVALTTDGSEVLGRLERVEPDGMAVVQIEGGCTLPGGDGATLTPGGKIVGALGAASAPGYIKTASSAGDALVARGRIEDATTTTAVKVYLD